MRYVSDGARVYSLAQWGDGVWVSENRAFLFRLSNANADDDMVLELIREFWEKLS